MSSFLNLLVATVLFTAAGVGLAQTVRIRGTIEGADGSAIKVRLSDGTHSKLVLSQGATVIAVLQSSLAEIKEGTFLGSAARPQEDGTQRALEVHIFPEEMRGTGEGHRPYAAVPQATMTNGATSSAPVSGVSGSTITLRYKDGEKKIIVPPDAPIVRYVRGDISDLKVGAHFTSPAATQRADGSYEAIRVNVGRNGVVPQ
jgi:hypothetical protein